MTAFLNASLFASVGSMLSILCKQLTFVRGLRGLIPSTSSSTTAVATQSINQRVTADIFSAFASAIINKDDDNDSSHDENHSNSDRSSSPASSASSRVVVGGGVVLSL